MTKGVTGCGQRVTYVESCDAPANNMARTCTWVLNSDSRPEKPRKKQRTTTNMDGTPASED